MNNLTSSEKSLRHRLVKSSRKKDLSHSRAETSVIFLEKESIDPIQSIEHASYEEEIARWMDNNKINGIEESVVKTKYDNLTRKICICTKNSAYINQKFDLKSLLNHSNVKDDILGFSRADRKKILKRLENLLFNHDLLNSIFCDPKVKKLIISDNIKVLYFDGTLKEKKYSPFVNGDELAIFKNLILKKFPDLKLKNSCLLENRETLLLIEKTSDNEEHFVFSIKKLRSRSPVFLDLIKTKTLSVTSGKFLMGHLSGTGNGLLITGDNSSGKTRTLAALSSGLVTNRYPAFSGNQYEFKYVLKDFYRIPSKNILAKYNYLDLEILSDKLFRSQVGIYVADDCSISELALAWLLSTKYKISSILTFSSSNVLETVLHYANSISNILGYQNEKEFFLLNFAKLFPIILNLNEAADSSFITISFKNDTLNLKQTNELIC